MANETDYPPPPEPIIRDAIEAARKSPCAKSKRGAVLFERKETGGGWPLKDPALHTIGFNGPPGMLVCDGSEACRSDCGRICVHAEARALSAKDADAAPLLELVHVKVVDGELVPSGPPSCEACSKQILDVGFVRVVWLYEVRTGHTPLCSCSVTPIGGYGCICPAGVWRGYSPVDFHLLSLENTKGGPLHVAREA